MKNVDQVISGISHTKGPPKAGSFSGCGRLRVMAVLVMITKSSYGLHHLLPTLKVP